MDFKENSGARSPGEGAPAKTGHAIKIIIINEKNIFGMVLSISWNILLVNILYNAEQELSIVSF
jgi:hypothetical protein